MLKTILFSMMVIIGTNSVDSTSDTGLIGFFEGECPEGWDQYKNLTGRFPMGSGNFSTGSEVTVAYIVGETGGEVKHNLTLSEIPSHSHRAVVAGSGSTCEPLQIESSQTCKDTEGQILNAGGSQSHNNMPPYLVLVSCIKNFDPDIENLQSRVTTLESIKTDKKYFWLWPFVNSFIAVLYPCTLVLVCCRNRGQDGGLQQQNQPLVSKEFF